MGWQQERGTEPPPSPREPLPAPRKSLSHTLHTSNGLAAPGALGHRCRHCVWFVRAECVCFVFVGGEVDVLVCVVCGLDLRCMCICMCGIYVRVTVCVL